MIIGGVGNIALLNSVELHNWKTGQQCLGTSLPYAVYFHSGVVMEQMPAFCGGYTTESVSNCFKFNISMKEWIQVSAFALQF